MLYGVKFWKVLDNVPRATNHKIKQQSYAEQRRYDVKFGTNPPHIQHVIYHIMRIIDILLHLTFSLFHIHIIFIVKNSGRYSSGLGCVLMWGNNGTQWSRGESLTFIMQNVSP